MRGKFFKEKLFRLKKNVTSKNEMCGLELMICLRFRNNRKDLKVPINAFQALPEGSRVTIKTVISTKKRLKFDKKVNIGDLFA